MCYDLSQFIDLLDEAEIIKQFVYENIQVLPCSNTDTYRGKGYILVPENKIKVYNIYLKR